jgi:hypothetical protein
VEGMKKFIIIVLALLFSIPVCHAQDFETVSKVRQFQKQIVKIGTYIWDSSDPKDLDPIRGTSWEFSWKYKETIEFGSETQTTTEGYVGLWVTSSRGWTGVLGYGDLVMGGRGYWMGYPDFNNDLIYLYEFKPSNNYTTGSGKVYIADLYTNELISTYSLSCKKISPLTTTTTISIEPPPNLECEVTPVSNLEGTLWKQVNRETYIGFYRGYLYQYFGETSPEDGFIKYGRFTEFGDNMFFMRYGLIIAFKTNMLGNWECDAKDCWMDAFGITRLVFIPFMSRGQYDLVCSNWQEPPQTTTSISSTTTTADLTTSTSSSTTTTADLTTSTSSSTTTTVSLTTSTSSSTTTTVSLTTSTSSSTTTTADLTTSTSSSTTTTADLTTSTSSSTTTTADLTTSTSSSTTTTV